MTTNFWTLACISLIAIAAAACTPAADTTAPTQTAAPAAPPPPDYAAIVASPERFATDTERDANRKPAEVLAFSKIMTGNTVFEMEAGGGYYTEMISRAVGPTGQVVMQGPKEFEQFYKADMDAHLADNRLANVRVSQSAFDTLDAPDASVDVVTWFQGPHEMYCKAACGNIPLGETAKAYQEKSPAS
jgi:predicted methyltransferase